mgnify:CR=1 FL=1
MSDLAILRSLQEAIRDGAVPASIVPTLPVKYIGISWATPSDQQWLEIVWLPNNRTSDFWASEKNHQGILRLILHWPNDNSGAYSPLEAIESIASYFTKGMMINQVQIYQPPDSQGEIGRASCRERVSSPV